MIELSLFANFAQESAIGWLLLLSLAARGVQHPGGSGLGVRTKFTASLSLSSGGKPVSISAWSISRHKDEMHGAHKYYRHSNRPSLRIPQLCRAAQLLLSNFESANCYFYKETKAMKLKSLKELFVDELKDLYSAENQLVKALPKMAKAATNPELSAGFAEHLEQTKGHVDRLEKICAQINVTPKGKKCAAMEGLIEEGKELLEADASPEVLDAGLIAAAQKVEHYEIASYGTVCTWARLLGLEAAATLLAETLEEEKATDEKLTGLSEQTINEEADAAEGGDEEEEQMAKAKNGSTHNGRGRASTRSNARASR